MDSLNYSSDNAGKMLIGERKKEERKREKTNFVLLIHILKDNFMSYVPILRSVFVPYLTYMHICKAFGYLFNIHMYMVNDIFTPSRYKEIIMVWPKSSVGLKGKPH